MDQRLSLITLGVGDLKRSRRFYEEGLGWTPAHSLDSVCFYQLPGLGLALFGRDDLAQDARRTLDGAFSGITLAINEPSRADVDAVFAQAKAAGAVVTKPPEDVFWGGYSGYFTDPDGHSWEVAWNPNCTIHSDGRTTF
jgi:catechol 2,3-dioxygenase-like lactoylglutathione lyase family enzyme